MIFWLALFFLSITTANVLFWPRVRRSADVQADAEVLDLAILIPARNEERNLGACLEAAIRQPVREILVYNDHSTDGTEAVIAAFSARDQRVRALSPNPLPKGWYGKTFACAQLAAHASSLWMIFLDADARLSPGAASSMVAEAVRRRLTFLSCWPRFETATFWEAVLMPLLNWVVFSIFPGPLSLFRKDRSLALAHGACIMARRDVYEKLGGHSAVANEIFEDTRLAQLWRERGERGLGLDGQHLVRVRMYASLEEIWRGFQKNFYLAFRREYNFWIFLALHFTVFLLPFLVLDWPTAALVLAARGLLLLRFRQAVWSLPFHPFAEVFLIALGLASRFGGKNVAWKGRKYA